MNFKLICVCLTFLTLISATVSDEKEVVCYVPDWGPDLTSKIDTSLCTMFIIAFGTIDLEGNLGLPYNFERFEKLRTPTSKLLVAINGANDEGRAAFSKVSSTAERRETFAQKCLDFVSVNKLDGIDIDWEFPSKEERENFVLIHRDVKNKFGNSYILTTAMNAGLYRINNVYDIGEVSKVVDFILMMTYDMHMDAEWDINSGVYFNAPIDATFSDYVNQTINKYLGAGASSNKLLLGIPFYGRIYQLSDPNRTAPRSPFNPGMQQHPENKPAYHVYCTKFTNTSWTKKRDEMTLSPYMYYGDSWISYEDEASIKEKVKLGTKYNLAGIMVWSLKQDDYDAVCSPCEWFLLKTINAAIGRITKIC